MHLQKAYERVLNFEQISSEAKLRFLEWKIVFSLDGLKTGADIALAFGLAEERAGEIFERLIERGVIAENEISLDDYRERMKMLNPDPASPQRSADMTGSETLNRPVVTLEQRTESDLPLSKGLPAPPSRRSTRQETSMNGTNGHGSSNHGAISFSVKKRFRLKSVLDFIQGHSGGGTLGQLAVYRTLMLIPGDLLRETGLQRLDFNDDSIEIDSPKLRKAIVEAIGKTLRVELPAGYFLE